MTDPAISAITQHRGLGALDSDIRPLLFQLEATSQLLSEAAGPGLPELDRQLRLMEETLGQVACDPPLSVLHAQRLLLVRNELSSHLLAASALTSLGMNAEAVSVLSRAVSTVLAGLRNVSELRTVAVP